MAGAERAALSLGARAAWVRRQTDTYFSCVSGRLKLRQAGSVEGTVEEEELISYDRSDNPRARVSRYRAVPVIDGDHLAGVLEEAFGVLARVVKVRSLFLIGSTRIHLDRVEGLGDFVEVERPLDPDENSGDAEAEVARIAGALGVERNEFVGVSNLDMAISAGRGGGAPKKSPGL